MGRWGELRECGLLLGIWLAPAAFLLIVQPKAWLNRKGIVRAGAVVAAVAVSILGADLYVGREADAEDALVPEMEDLTAHATGNVYVNDLPMLYQRQVKGVRLPATRDSGFEVEDNVSIVFNEYVERRELLEYGFQVARLEDGHLVYTNDEALVDHLKARGTEVYRYYPFGHEADLEYLAELNGLTLTEDGHTGRGRAREAADDRPGCHPFSGRLHRVLRAAHPFGGLYGGSAGDPGLPGGADLVRWSNT